uniref:Uncharacterized protein n=1 Tax=Amphora coffeiformis TaxID=265554 RepID=A0A7S3L046_9STRA
MQKGATARGRVVVGRVQIRIISVARLVLLACGGAFLVMSLALWQLHGNVVVEQQQQQQQQQRDRNSLLPPTFTPSPNSRSNSQQDKDIYIFYHIFLPNGNNQTEYQNALAVVDEHVTQITHNLIHKTNYTKASIRAATSSRVDTIHFHYTTVGAGLPSEDYLAKKYSYSNVMNYVHVQHVDMVSDPVYEEVSLQALYDHCQEPSQVDNYNAKVVYMHSKGTFHNTRENVNFRRSITNAVLHPDCLELNVDQCNVCALQFVPFPIHAAGNMWTASCSYVRQLIPPLEFRPRIEEAAEYIQSMKQHGRLQMRLSAISNTMLGKKRYSNQHWIGTHPNVVPCQMADPNIRLEHWRQLYAGDFNYTTSDGMVEVLPPTGKIHKKWFKTMSTFHGIAAPALPLGQIQLKWLKNVHLIANVTDRRREITLLPGLFQYWDHLYNGSRPADNSWFWDYYPDGDYFRSHPDTKW